MKPIIPDVESPGKNAKLTIEQDLQKAFAHHQTGHLQEAGELYLSILQSHPDHAEANYNMGVLAVQMKQPVAGLPYFMAALDADPARGQYWLNYIDALFQAGQLEDARQILALARQQGLQGDEVEALALRLEGGAHIAEQPNAESQQAIEEPLPVSSVVPQNSQKILKTKHVKPDKSAKKSALRKGEIPSSQEINTLVTLFSKGLFTEAAPLAQAMTVRFPLHELGWNVLGLVFKQMGRNADALAPLQKAALLSPNDADAYSNLGNILSDLGRPDEAEVSLRRALQINPDYAEAHSNLGATLYDLGRLDEAAACYRRALQIKPGLAEAHYNLGNTLKDMGRLDEAEASYRRALQINQNYADAHNNLGNILKNLGRLDEAEASCRRALQIKPDLAEAHSNLGIILQDMGQLDEAEASYRRALQIKPDLAEVHSNLGNTLQDMGRLDEAEASYRRALKIKPDYVKAHSSLSFILNYTSSNAPSHGLAEALQYGRKVGNKITSRFTEWSCAKQPERLRIGFVSGDFRNHPVGYFLESLLTQLDPTSVELIAYPTDNQADALTARIKPHFSAWKPLFGLNDEAAARLIHSDSVHVLIDLSGHSRYNRLPVFAWKPAPVQVSWLGYFATTGVAEIDYLIADPWTLPETEEAYFTEKIWRLPETRLCFTPPDIDLEVSQLPALTNGHVTFGCFNNLTKMNDEVVTVWSRVLASVPSSRLFLKAKQLKEASVRQHTIERFAVHGIDASRLILEGPESREKYLAAYHRVDITLDPFPYPGGTTSVESLWMGVPVLTLAGERFLSRQGIGILMNSGLPEWIAADTDDYVTRIASHAGDLQRLAKLRDGLRKQVLASPLFDAANFARHFEEAIWGMWKNFQAQQETSPNERERKQLSPVIEIVSATRLSESEFWSKAALGISLRRLAQDTRLVAHIAFENRCGLPDVFNARIDAQDSHEILVFIHDDVWIDDDSLADHVIEGLKTFDVIGVAGNRRRVRNQPCWAFIDEKLTWDAKANLSGRVGHGRNPFGAILDYGAAPAECELLDGVFLAVEKSKLKRCGVRFDPRFDFHFYDMDFCRNARKNGLRLGTWQIDLTHQSVGAFGSRPWVEKYHLYLEKWEEKPTSPAIIPPQQSVSLTIEQTLHKAIAHHQAGQLQEAGELYRTILQSQPNHPEANHNMGVLAVQMKQPADGLPYLMTALDADSARGQYWVSYIDALFQAGQMEDAREVLALAQQQGLEGDDVNALVARLEGDAQIAEQSNAEDQHASEESLPVSPASPQNSQKNRKTKPTKTDKSAKKTAKHHGKTPSPQEINTLIALFTDGHFTEAASLAQKMTVRFPLHEFGWKMLGVVFKRMGRSADALAPLQKAAALSPGDVEAYYNLGVTLQDLGRLDEAEASYRRTLQIKPNYAEAHSNLGLILHILGRLDEAATSYRQALQIKPGLAMTHYNLGNTLKNLGRLGEAEASYRRALHIKPDYAEVHCNLGNALSDLGRLDEAEASYRLALHIKPDYIEAHNNLSATLHTLGRLSEAETSYRRALQIKPDYAEAHSNLGITLKELGRFAEAETSDRRALQINPDLAIAHQNLATILAYLSDFDQVVTESDTALNLKPDDAAGWEQRLYVFSYHPDLTAEQIYAEFVRWGDRFPDPVVDFSAHDRTPGRRLRIGYVSPDFRRHTSRFFFWPLFSNHDHAVVELYAYSNVGVEDDFTQKFKGLFDYWRNIRGVADGEVARMIREDGIDILVDCCSHMRDDRLGVFTLKPAPIQATWLGAAWTTGLKMVDYALIDPYMAPEGTLTRETIVRLPHCFVAYRPPEVTAEIAPPPCLRNGYITFGYSGRTERLNHHTFRVWGDILRQTPTARLILDFRSFDDPPTQAHYRQFMLRHGMDPSRVIMRNSANIFAGLNDIDILLDCFPHSGGTMLFDALWMGVPILTLASRPPVGRIGTTLMINLGLPEWVAESQDEYITKAGTLSRNVQALAQLRAGMRERMQNSPLMDGPGFAREVEAAYREMFEKWADGPHAAEQANTGNPST